MTTFTVNGEERTWDGDPYTPALWVLRDALNLTGTKFGCGVGLCGACTIHVDGEARRGCQTFVADLEGAEVTTIEGLSEDGSHALQKAWIKHGVPQCGYCQAGQIMQAATLLSQNSQPTDEEITSHMDGNICRCGAYKRIHAAIKDAAKEISNA